MREPLERIAVLVNADQKAFEAIAENVEVVEVIDCRGFEQCTLEAILAGRAERSDLSVRSAYNFIVFNGLTSESVGELMSLIKSLMHRDWIFATTTQTNLNWKLIDLQRELSQEHDYFKFRGEPGER